MHINQSGLLYRIAVVYGKWNSSSYNNEPDNLCALVRSFMFGLLSIFVLIVIAVFLSILLMEPIFAIIMNMIYHNGYYFLGDDEVIPGGGVGCLFLVGVAVWFMIILCFLGALHEALIKIQFYNVIVSRLKSITERIPSITKKPKLAKLPKQPNMLIENISDIFSTITGKMCVHLNYYNDKEDNRYDDDSNDVYPEEDEDVQDNDEDRLCDFYVGPVQDLVIYDQDYKSQINYLDYALNEAYINGNVETTKDIISEMERLIETYKRDGV